MSDEEQEVQSTELADLVSDLDLDTPLSELVEDPALLDQAIELDQQELDRLAELEQEYLQDLSERGMIPDELEMDIDPQLVEPEREPPSQEIDIDIDFDR